MLTKILNQVRTDTTIWKSKLHGLEHWKRVEANGHLISSVNGSDRSVISYFSYLHDSQRWNEDHDPEHGPRACLYAKRHRDLIDLDDNQFDLLLEACANHTHAMPEQYSQVEKTVATCWDADRLDIGRVGVDINANYLFTVFAKEFAA